MYRSSEFRLLPRNGTKSHKLYLMCGASSRKVWNEILALVLFLYAEAKEKGEKPPGVDRNTLYNHYPALREQFPWLDDYHVHTIRYALK